MCYISIVIVTSLCTKVQSLIIYSLFAGKVEH